PPPRPGLGSSAKEQRPPGGVLLPARVLSMRLPSLQSDSGVERGKGTYFQRTGIAHETAGNLQRVFQGFTVDQVKSEKLFLGLGKGTVEHQRLTAGSDRHGCRR